MLEQGRPPTKPRAYTTGAYPAATNNRSPEDYWRRGAEPPRPRVLVAENDQRAAVTVGLILYEAGIDIELATKGEDAIAAARARPPDAIILDLAMPDVDGNSVYSELRRLRMEAPVIIASAFGAETARRRLGAEACITKPFESDVLLNTLFTLLDAANMRSRRLLSS